MGDGQSEGGPELTPERTAPDAATPALHHVAFACRDVDETHRFYSEVLGLTLVRTEVKGSPRHYLRHIFYDLGDGSAIAFFHLQGVGEPEDLRTAISTDLDLPVWVNHIAIRTDATRQAELRRRCEEAGFEVTLELDHDWCHSVYVTDPNGILVEFCRDTPGLPVEPDVAVAMLHDVPAERPR